MAELLRIDAPIVCWLSPIAAVNKWFVPDLEARCHFVNNKSQLGELLKQYEDGTLQSKWRADFNKKYGGLGDSQLTSKNFSEIMEESR